MGKKKVADEEIKEVAELGFPESPFVQIGSYREQDGGTSLVSAWDIPHCGCVVRTKHILGNCMTVSEVFVPNAGIRGGKVTRSMI